MIRVAWLALSACATQRASLGPNLGVKDGTFGAELTGEMASGGEGIGLVAAGAARVGHGLSGGSLRLGVEITQEPLRWAGRLTATMGPTWIGSEEGGGGDVTLDARISFSLFKGYPVSDDWAESEHKTIGIELFVSSIGVETERHDALIGVALTLGTFGRSSSGWVHVSPPPRDW